MSHSLLGKDVDDVLVEFWGPHEGRNYFITGVAPQLRLQVFGADAADEVTVEENTTLEIVGTNNSGAIGSSPVRGGKLLPTRAAGDWVALGTAQVSDGLVTIALTARANPYGIRVRVSTKTDGVAGDGGVEVATEWN